jgi:hypothetical protein
LIHFTDRKRGIIRAEDLSNFSLKEIIKIGINGSVNRSFLLGGLRSWIFSGQAL